MASWVNELSGRACDTATRQHKGGEKDGEGTFDMFGTWLCLCMVSGAADVGGCRSLSHSLNCHASDA